MKIFISHAISDKELIKNIQTTLLPSGINLFIAEHHQEFNTTITEKIENMIRQSDFAIFLLTKNGFNSKFVQQEIGFVHSIKKPYMQLVEIGLQKEIAGFNFGRDYLEFNPSQPEPTLTQMRDHLLRFWKEKQDRINRNKMELERALAQQRLQKEKQEKAALALLGGFLILAMLSK